MKERIPKRIRDPDRTWLAMAAYNIGIGHLEDARIITQMRKKNPDRWADVRANLPRLSDPHWHTRVKRGYANGRETAQFVERVSQFAAILEATIPQLPRWRRTSYLQLADLDAAESHGVAVVLQQDAALRAPRRIPASP